MWLVSTCLLNVRNVLHWCEWLLQDVIEATNTFSLQCMPTVQLTKTWLTGGRMPTVDFLTFKNQRQETNSAANNLYRMHMAVTWRWYHTLKYHFLWRFVLYWLRFIGKTAAKVLISCHAIAPPGTTPSSSSVFRTFNNMKRLSCRYFRHLRVVFFPFFGYRPQGPKLDEKNLTGRD